MENEVRKRDEIISQLQKRIQELERLGLAGMSPTAQLPGEDPTMAEEPLELTAANLRLSKNGSSGSDDASVAEEGFMVREMDNSFVVSMKCMIYLIFELTKCTTQVILW